MSIIKTKMVSVEFLKEEKAKFNDKVLVSYQRRKKEETKNFKYKTTFKFRIKNSVKRTNVNTKYRVKYYSQVYCQLFLEYHNNNYFVVSK